MNKTLAQAEDAARKEGRLEEFRGAYGRERLSGAGEADAAASALFEMGIELSPPLGPMKLEESSLLANLPVNLDKRHWIRAGEGRKVVEIGILVTDEGVSVDVWAHDGQELLVESNVLWDDLNLGEE